MIYHRSGDNSKSRPLWVVGYCYGGALVRMFFVDESGTPEAGGTNFIVLAGLILKCEDWRRLHEKFAALKASFGIGQDVEIKWRHIRHPGGRRSPLQGVSESERIRFATATLGLIRQTTSARVIGVAIDKIAAYQRSDISTDDDVYEAGVLFAMERYQYYLEASRDQGIVVQDERRPRQDFLLRAFYRGLLADGTRWAQFRNIIEGVFLTPSHYSTGVHWLIS